MNPDFDAIFTFCHELEKLKSVSRRIKPNGLDRYENSAEHSWQIALLALSLLPNARTPLDPLKVVTMLLLHDVVEIDTGDKFAYHANHDDYDNELLAAKRIFGMLPAPQSDDFLTLWIEFEQAQSEEARFAKGIDRLMPVLQNLNNGGQSWLEHGIRVSQILAKNAGVEAIHPQLWATVKERVIALGEQIGLQQ
ncbi:HD domain-containing protein [Aestuariibacter halophilus]|uniref:5'-deoxynucleotidase n=1 Tax=Fluctibacter halophilus TaxID=226011 RepID=A0ABS8GCQ3_9ALTE|nr:HD domain-containing protein [Aestuariibacter halophilus]MCC2617574.1 HD domain-containing protein [Aestuariibacter halophilus]